MIKYISLGVLALAAPVEAQTVTKETPREVAYVAAVGDVVWERSVLNGTPGVVVAQAVQANWGTAEVVDIPAESALMIIREKKLKACRARTSLTLSGMTFLGWDDCLIDKDDDGRFELVSFNDVGGSKPLNPPVAYSRAMVPVAGAGGNSFRKILSYLGKSGLDLRLSYREYSNDMARPAFTEELTLPVGSGFPQKFRIKDISMTVSAIDGEGLHYSVN